ncbi:hypothetical protein [Streptomyces cavernicola]|uniref:DUF4145 domain-containing protein n=1 Tax=Streptomyces cavernicola TaxID=3043613 RepID=A0ABT6SI69_9ACTN|nr:hypothetical protein [Streptomyces sp. B-S-A6]MDI3407670.1 hypothetical protein [Streptomyces sp. B-S-A6]
MRLERSRKALTLAEKYLQLLEELIDDREAFEDAFVGAIAVIRRVGNAVDFESTKLATLKFKELWSESGKDRRFLCVKDVRNLVLHEASEEARVRHEVLAIDTAMARATAYNPTVITGTAHIDVVRDGEEPERYTFSTTPPPPETERVEPTYRRTWMVANGKCAGEELIPTLRKYLEWMRDEVIPEAERLLETSD